MEKIARLVEVDLREVWDYEAHDFTPWLASNLDLLGEALGIDIEPLGETEVAVGPFSLDIYARDANENRTIIIENQLEKTDHDHLGKVLTYAAGFNADVMVWIVKEFQDEHRLALDWLNQRTSEETEFYGVVVRAVRIGNSPPAPVFDVVARPNRKRRIGSEESGQLTEIQQKYLEFWPRVIDRLRDDHSLTKRRKSTSRHWFDFRTGIRNVIYRVSFANRQRARVALRLDGNKTRNKALFNRLHDQGKERFEEAFGERFEWERLDNYKVSRIALYMHNRSIRDSEETLSDTAIWMVENVVRLSETVIPIVREAALEVDSRIGSPSSEQESWDEEEEEDRE